MSPHGTPLARCSIACAARASSVGSKPTPATVVAAIESATSNAALDDNPDPIGTVEVTAASKPGTGRSMRVDTTVSVAATARAHGAISLVAGSSTRASRSSDVTWTRPSARGRKPTRTSRSIAIGRQNPS